MSINLYQKCIERIEKNAQLKRDGKWVGIPYPYERLRQFQPSIDKEQVIGITSYTGAAKSKFARYTFIMHPYEFSIKNNYPLLIDYYALEDSAIRVYMNILCSYLYLKHNIQISLWDLESKFRELSSTVRQKIKEGERYLQDFSNVVRIKDSITNPYGIYLDIIKTAESLGEIIWQEFDYNGERVKKIVGFKPKDETHWMALCDNLNNIDKEKKHFNQKEAMDSFVMKDIRLTYSKIFKMTWAIIHQQALEAERQQFTNAGGSIIEKIKPSLANLGGTKEVVRSYHLVFSLFNPHKFKIENYSGYNIKTIGNNFRELEVLKSNDGFDSTRVPLYFDGAAEFFRELPNSQKHKEQLDKFYEWLQADRLSKKANNLLF